MLAVLVRVLLAGLSGLIFAGLTGWAMWQGRSGLGFVVLGLLLHGLLAPTQDEAIALEEFTKGQR